MLTMLMNLKMRIQMRLNWRLMRRLIRTSKQVTNEKFRNSPMRWTLIFAFSLEQAILNLGDQR